MRVGILLALLLGLAACGENSSIVATPQSIAAVSYRDEGPAKLTVITMVNNRSGSGGHTALMINGPQRILFDPAGSFRTDSVPERGDVLYGITPQVFDTYKSSHSRATHHVVTQEFEVTAAQAQVAYQLATQNGPVPGAFCTSATTKILSQVPGFEWVDKTFYPVKLQQQLEPHPGVKTEKYYEDDDGNVVDAVAKL
ncbi:MAG: hypothetical protein ABJI96_07630 [Paracoccaceae bacterium]